MITAIPLVNPATTGYGKNLSNRPIFSAPSATNITPAMIVATQLRDGKAVRTRPLCPYPQVARYSGSGSPDDAANFACKAPD